MKTAMIKRFFKKNIKKKFMFNFSLNIIILQYRYILIKINLYYLKIFYSY